jgi:outer membrane biosynthesis protein TonB
MRRVIRSLFAGALALVLVGGSLNLAVLPAAAEEPTPPPTVEPTPEPTDTEPAPPETDPAQPETTEPAPEPEPTESPTPTESPAPTPERRTVEYTGTVNMLSSEDHGAESAIGLFISSQGVLAVDTSTLTEGELRRRITVALAVPESVVLTGDSEKDFAKLSSAAAKQPLVVISARSARSERETSAFVNQTPNAAATHRIYAVLVSPDYDNTAVSARPTASNFAASVAHADEYWSQQSSQSIGFDLVGTVPWYRSTYSCDTAESSFALWNQAASKAAASLGYQWSKNNHLVLVFPSNTTCALGIGLGTVGWSVNEGGWSWVIGDGAGTGQAAGTGAMEKQTLAHELGHNLSLGHATWIDCSTANPVPGFVGYDGSICVRKDYGDITDVMGGGVLNRDGGALSSAQAIRAGIWPSSAWVTAPQGTTGPYTLQDITADSGTRGIVVQDNNGVNYFVEYRNFSNEDAQYANDTCATSSCVAADAGVRILRLENASVSDEPGYTGMLGFWGDDSFLIGRNTGSDRVNLTAGEVFWSQGLNNTNGIRVTVNSIDGATASVQIYRATNNTTVNPTSQFWIMPTSVSSTDPDVMRVGDTWTALIGDTWEAETTTITWFTAAAPFDNSAGTQVGTGPNYTLSTADIGKHLFARVVGSNPSQATQLTLYDYSGYMSDGPISAGKYLVDDPGTVSINNSTTPLAATTADYPAGTTFTYQWYRGSTATTATTAITGATAVNYTPTSSDYGKFLRVRVAATIPGYSNKPVRYSAAKNYSIVSAWALTATGTPKVGTVLTVDDSGMTYETVDGELTGVTRTYQWLRDGVPITGNPDATDDADYETTSSDYGKKISLRVTSSKPGWVSKVTTSSSMTITQVGTIETSSPEAEMTVVVDKPGELYSFKITASTTGVIETGTSASYQWYRVNRTTLASTAITGATSQSYRPVAADYAYELKVRVIVKKSNFTSLTLMAEPRDFSVRINPGFPVLLNDTTPVPDFVLTHGPLQFQVEEFNGGIYNFQAVDADRVNFAWYRSGTAITGATADTYTVKAADIGSKLSYRLTVGLDGWLPMIKLPSPSTATIVAATFDDVPTPGISQTGLTLSVAVADSTPTQTSRTYQWYRNGVAVTGKTAVSYVLTSADWGKDVTVKVTYKRSGFTNVVRWGESTTGSYDWWIDADPALPIIRGEVDGDPVNVGATVRAVLPTFYNPQTEGELTLGADVTATYQWYRNGVALTGKTAATYPVVSADKGQSLTVKVTTAHVAGELVSNVATSRGTIIGSATIPGSPEATVTVTPNSAGTLEATVDGVTDPVTYKYQWYRDNTAITGKTASSYALSSSDNGKVVWVRVTISRAAVGSTTYTTIVRDSARIDYSIFINEAASPYLSSGNPSVSGSIALYGMNFDTKDGDLASPTFKYQWLRNGVAITGATNENYSFVAADYNTKVGVRVTVSSPGYASLIFTLTYSTVIAKGVTSVPLVEVVPSGVGRIKAQLESGTLTPATPTPSFTYQWYRDNPADATPAAKITGATSSTYTLTSSDRGRELTVQVVMKRTNFTTPTLTLARPTETDYTIRAESGAKPTISGTVAVGEQLTATPPSYFEADGTTPLGPAPTLTYTWYRNGTAISGQTAETYTLTASDRTTKITVKVKATLPGRLAHTSAVSTATAAVAYGTLDDGSLVLSTESNMTIYPKVQVKFTGTVVTPGVSYTYKWFRDGVAVTGATAVSYTLTSADSQKVVSVVVTMKKTGYTSEVYDPIIANEVNDFGVDIIINGTPAAGNQLSASPPLFYLVNGADTFDYTMEWFRDDVLVTTGNNSYNVTVADEGTTLKFRVTLNAPFHAPLVLEKTIDVPTP